MQPGWVTSPTAEGGVSILTRPEGRMQPAVPPQLPLLVPVSILTRPEGRMQPFQNGPPRPRAWCFNPHPARRPDATRPVMSRTGRYSGFNPHPARRPDATIAPELHVVPPAQFQSSPGPKAGCNGRKAKPLRLWSRFQSSPGPKAGCNDVQYRVGTAGAWFQSSPGPKAGCNMNRRGAPVPGMKFQSSPGPKAGCNTPTWASGTRLACFNPHPARRPDATT